MKIFEIYFNITLKKTITKFVFKLTKYIQLEKELKEDYDGNFRFSKESISTVNQFLKTGVELAYFSDNMVINDFTINNCDNSQMALAFSNNGNKKLNVLNNFITKKHSDDFFKVLEFDNASTNYEENYKQSLDYNFLSRADNTIYSKYSEIGWLLLDTYINQKKNDIFVFKKNIPPSFFNDIQSDYYFEVNPYD